MSAPVLVFSNPRRRPRRRRQQAGSHGSSDQVAEFAQLAQECERLSPAHFRQMILLMRSIVANLRPGPGRGLR